MVGRLFQTAIMIRPENRCGGWFVDGSVYVLLRVRTQRMSRFVLVFRKVGTIPGELCCPITEMLKVLFSPGGLLAIITAVIVKSELGGSLWADDERRVNRQQ